MILECTDCHRIGSDQHKDFKLDALAKLNGVEVWWHEPCVDGDQRSNGSWVAYGRAYPEGEM